MNEARIKDLRAARGWSQERLAEASGVAVRTIQRLEAGNDASLETLSMVAKALEVSVRDLFVTVDDDLMGVAVDGLDARLAAERAGRRRAERAHRGWRYLYVALGLLVTAVVLIVVGSPDSTGEAILVVPAYWLGGLLVLRFLERSVLRPRLDARYPLTAEDAR